MLLLGSSEKLGGAMASPAPPVPTTLLVIDSLQTSIRFLQPFLLKRNIIIAALWEIDKYSCDEPNIMTRKYPLRGFILGVLTHTTTY